MFENEIEVMTVLIPMAGTMTSFGAIKSAVVATTECAPKPENLTEAQMRFFTDVPEDPENCTYGEKSKFYSRNSTLCRD